MNHIGMGEYNDNDEPIMLKIGSSSASIDNVPNSPQTSPEKNKIMQSINAAAAENKLSLRRNTSYGNMLTTNSKEAKVLVIYTGGTIGMIRNRNNGILFIFD